MPMINSLRKIIRLLKNNILFLRIRIFKIYNLIKFPNLWRFLPKKIVPGFEHLRILKNLEKVNTLIDCGSNKGQFAILLYELLKIKYYLSFDPIIIPNEINKFFKKNKVNYHHENIALSSENGISEFHITEREDSSSLKRTIEDSSLYCPDVFHKKTIKVQVKRLDDFINKINLFEPPIALKIDVQGSEYELLMGAKDVLKIVDYLFIEISFESLYEETISNNKIFKLLNESGFKKVSAYNPLYRREKLLSKDFLFIKSSIKFN